MSILVVALLTLLVGNDSDREKSKVPGAAILISADTVPSPEPGAKPRIFIGSEDESNACVAKRKLTYETPNVELSGHVVRKKYYGPPNYGETPQEDAVEDVVLLMLDEPFSIAALKDGLHEAHACIDRVQLTGGKPLSKGEEHVTLRGTLFGGVTAHHRTKVLLQVAIN